MSFAYWTFAYRYIRLSRVTQTKWTFAYPRWTSAYLDNLPIGLMPIWFYIGQSSVKMTFADPHHEQNWHECPKHLQSPHLDPHDLQVLSGPDMSNSKTH